MQELYGDTEVGHVDQMGFCSRSGLARLLSGLFQIFKDTGIETRLSEGDERGVGGRESVEAKM